MFKKILFAGSRLATGLAMKKGMEFVFDYGLYPIVLAWLGYLWGGIGMTILATILNVLIIRAYDWAKVDWLLIEEVKAIRDTHTHAHLPGILNWLKPLLRMGDVPAFFILCLDDPVTATLYLRKGSHLYNGLDRRGWLVFIAANVVSNLYWTLGIAAVFESVKFFT